MDAPLTAKISAILHIYNEQRQIKKCLESIRWVDEIVIMDCFSQDKTVEICRKYTDRIYQRKYINAAEAKNWLLTQATCGWVLAIDADERCTGPLAGEIREKIAQQGDIDGYRILLRTFCFGREMRGWPKGERQIRLFKKNLGSWEHKEVHSKLLLDGKKEDLLRPLLHYPYPTLKALCDKENRYARFQAQAMVKDGVGLSWQRLVKVSFSPFTIFYRQYFLQRSYQDGLAGLCISLITALYFVITEIDYLILKFNAWF